MDGLRVGSGPDVNEAGRSDVEANVRCVQDIVVSASPALLERISNIPLAALNLIGVQQ